MKIKQLMEMMEADMPRQAALDWDNVGLLVGDEEQEVSRIYLALDATDEVIDHGIAFGDDLILTHHPLIFSGIKKVTAQDMTGRRIRKMIAHQISYYAMHTNFDVCVMGNLSAQYLGLRDVDVLDVTYEPEDGKKGIGCVGSLSCRKTLLALAKEVRQTFGLSHVKVFGDGDTMMERVAVCPGSGKSEIAAAKAKGAQVLITGDIDHHSGIDAVAEGLCIVDAGHYGIEHIYMDYMKEWLMQAAPQIAVAQEPMQEPFWIV